MINRLFEQLKVAINSDQRNKVAVHEFNTALSLILTKLYKQFFEDYKRKTVEKNRYGKGKDMSDDTMYYAQLLEYYLRIDQTITKTGSVFSLPPDLKYVQALTTLTGDLFDKVTYEKWSLYNKSNIAKPTICYPIFIQTQDGLLVSPDFNSAKLTYLRKHKQPKLTYTVVTMGGVEQELFNPNAPDFQDIDMHESMEVNIFNELLLYFGVNNRAMELTQLANQETTEQRQADNS